MRAEMYHQPPLSMSGPFHPEHVPVASLPFLLSELLPIPSTKYPLLEGLRKQLYRYKQLLRLSTRQFTHRRWATSGHKSQSPVCGEAQGLCSCTAAVRPYLHIPRCTWVYRVIPCIQLVTNRGPIIRKLSWMILQFQNSSLINCNEYNTYRLKDSLHACLWDATSIEL